MSRARAPASPWYRSSVHARACVFACVTALALHATACRTSATQLDLVIDSSCPATTSDREVALVVRDRAGAVVHTETIAASSRGWPIERTLTPAGDAHERGWSVDATLRAGTDVLDVQRAAGGYTEGARTRETLTLRDPTCTSTDAGTVTEPPDGGADSPDSGCGAARRAAGPALYYRFREDPARPDVIVEAGASRALDLVGGTGTVAWTADGARIVAADARPAVARDATLSDALAACQGVGAAPGTGLTIEAWLTLPTTPLPVGERAEIAAVSHRGTLQRSLFTLGMASDAFIAGVDGCDSQMRPLYRFPLGARGVPVHVVYVRRGTTEHAFVDGVEMTLARGALPSELDSREESGTDPVDAGGRWPLACSEGDVAGRAIPGSRLGGTTLADAPQTLHLGSIVPPGADSTYAWAHPFAGTYHLFALYCRPLEDSEIREHHCVGPRPE